MDNSTIIFTGFRPTGDLHLGHYFSFIKPIINILQNTDHHIFILIADLHSLTELRKTNTLYINLKKEITTHILDNIRTILQFVPKKYYDRLVIFKQSDLELYHLGLFYRLLMISKNNMTLGNPVFKDAMKNEINDIINEFNLNDNDLSIFNSVVYNHPYFLYGNINESDSSIFNNISISEDSIRYIIKRINSRYGILGMMCYPILMAADIILYKPQAVLIGSDQEPHLQITNDMIKTINSLYDMSVSYTKPMILNDITLKGSDGRKMSKTLRNYISINELLDFDGGKNWFNSMKTFSRKLSECGDPNNCIVGEWYKSLNLDDKIFDLCKSASIGCVFCKKQLYEQIKKIIENDLCVKTISDEEIVDKLYIGYYRAYQRLNECDDILDLLH